VGRDAQTSLLVGGHFGDLPSLVAYYLPKPAIDLISYRRTELLKNRGESSCDVPSGLGSAQAENVPTIASNRAEQ
jgi:hypothetical protein